MKFGETICPNADCGCQGRLATEVAEVKTLSGLLPICACCKKIRDDRGYWNRIESYIMQRSNASFSHGYCPACAIKSLEAAGVPVSDELRKKAYQDLQSDLNSA